MMELKIGVLIFCGYNVFVVSSRLVHIQSCRQASLDTQCLLTYIQNVTGQLATQNEQLLVNTTRHLANKSKLNRFGTQMELVAQTVTSQTDLLANGLATLATKTEFDNVVEEITGHNHVQTLKNEIIETKIELVSQKVTNQNELLSTGIENLATKTELDNVIEELTGHIQELTIKSGSMETQMEELSQKVTSQSEKIHNLTTETQFNIVIEELRKQMPETSFDFHQSISD